jgi:hypothetical protein
LFSVTFFCFSFFPSSIDILVWLNCHLLGSVKRSTYFLSFFLSFSQKKKKNDFLIRNWWLFILTKSQWFSQALIEGDSSILTWWKTNTKIHLKPLHFKGNVLFFK